VMFCGSGMFAPLLVCAYVLGSSIILASRREYRRFDRGCQWRVWMGKMVMTRREPTSIKPNVPGGMVQLRYSEGYIAFDHPCITMIHVRYSCLLMFVVPGAALTWRDAPMEKEHKHNPRISPCLFSASLDFWCLCSNPLCC